VPPPPIESSSVGGDRPQRPAMPPGAADSNDNGN
jgi:hypothetical protein